MEHEKELSDRWWAAVTDRDHSTTGSGRQLLPDAVAQSIQARILDGTLKPGDRLPPERQLAEQMQVNRGSVREALKKLEQLRLVRVQQGSGIRVRDAEQASLDLVCDMLFVDGVPNLPWVRDVLEIREMVIPGVLRRAMERATHEQIDQMAELLQLAAAPDEGEEDFAGRLRTFSDYVFRLSGNRIAMMLANSLRLYMAHPGFRPLGLHLQSERASAAPQLQRLAVAIHARDYETAERAIAGLHQRLGGSVLKKVEEWVALADRRAGNA